MYLYIQFSVSILSEFFSLILMIQLGTVNFLHVVRLRTFTLLFNSLTLFDKFTAPCYHFNSGFPYLFSYMLLQWDNYPLCPILHLVHVLLS